MSVGRGISLKKAMWNWKKDGWRVGKDRWDGPVPCPIEVDVLERRESSVKIYHSKFK